MASFIAGIGLLALALLTMFLWPGSSRARIVLAGVAIAVLCFSAVRHPGERWVSLLMVLLGLGAIARELGSAVHHGDVSRP